MKLRRRIGLHAVIDSQSYKYSDETLTKDGGSFFCSLADTQTLAFSTWSPEGDDWVGVHQTDSRVKTDPHFSPVQRQKKM
jgi:hypothetical protein